MTKLGRLRVTFLLWMVLTDVTVFTTTSVLADEALSDTVKRHKIDEMYVEYKESFPEVEDLSAEEVLRLMGRTKMVFVDVREPKEQAVSMLPGAITDREFLQNIESYKDHQVIGYCTISYRSGKLARKLQKKGIRMINLRGGILAWIHAGGQVYKDGKPVKKIHVYGKKWDLAPSDYESIR